MQHRQYTAFVPNFSGVLVARYIVNKTGVNQFHDQYTHVVGIDLQQRMLSRQEYRTLIDLLGTVHLSSLQFHSTLLDTLSEPERTDHESRILKILGQGFMNLLPPLPFPETSRQAPSTRRYTTASGSTKASSLLIMGAGPASSLAGRPSDIRLPQRMWPVMVSTSRNALASRIGARI